MGASSFDNPMCFSCSIDSPTSTDSTRPTRSTKLPTWYISYRLGQFNVLLLLCRCQQSMCGAHGGKAGAGVQAAPGACSYGGAAAGLPAADSAWGGTCGAGRGTRQGEVGCETGSSCWADRRRRCLVLGAVLLLCFWCGVGLRSWTWYLARWVQVVRHMMCSFEQKCPAINSNYKLYCWCGGGWGAGSVAVRCLAGEADWQALIRLC